MRSNAHFSKKLRHKRKMSQLFIAVPWKNEVRYQKSERNPSLKIVLTASVRSFIKISQKMASQIVTTNEKVGDVTRTNFSGQRCDRRDATSTKTRRNKVHNKVHNCIKVWASLVKIRRYSEYTDSNFRSGQSF